MASPPLPQEPGLPQPERWSGAGGSSLAAEMAAPAWAMAAGGGSRWATGPGGLAPGLCFAGAVVEQKLGKFYCGVALVSR